MKRVDLEVAVAAGLSVVLPLYEIFTRAESDGSPNPLTLGEAAALLLALASYLIAPSPLRLLRSRRVGRLVWLWTPVFGSLLIAVALHCWRARSPYWSPERSAVVWLALCAWTLPLAAAVHYPGMVIRRFRRWHEGPEENLSILQGR